MHRKVHKIYMAAIVVGVAFAAGLIYYVYFAHSPSLARTEKPQHIIQKFPDPRQTTYCMGLYLDMMQRVLYGSTVLETVNTTKGPINELWFTVYPDAFRDASTSPAPVDAYYDGFDPGWIKIKKFKVNGRINEYEIRGVSVKIPLSGEILPGKKMKIEINWECKIPKLAYGYGSKDGVFMLENFYPAMNIMDEKSWQHSEQAPQNRLGFQSANYIVRLNIPDGYSFISPGRVSDSLAEDNGRQTFMIDGQNIRDFCLLVMYDYKEIKAEVKGRTLKAFVPSSQAGIERSILKNSGEILDYYSRALGEYPDEELALAIVPVKTSHGMEHTGLILLGQDVLAGKAECKKILADSMAHLWWHNLVGSDSLNEPWLEEGLAWWSAQQYLQSSRIEAAEPELPAQYKDKADFCFVLEKKLDRDDMFRILQRLIREFRYGMATGYDLNKIIEDETNQDIKSCL
ncbi:M1 family aminopeptidase [Syntrophomonas palmitatica]|uniref:M1 family aminopeptidase n=1 Tax=Syntrophomonas palmitatica TaxID=402877 RepID=UPI0006D27439|nr:M1 family aminopeptidase [Syntrophomonas palmitatica]